MFKASVVEATDKSGGQKVTVGVKRCLLDQQPKKPLVKRAFRL